MSNIVKFSADSALPAYLSSGVTSDVNKDVFTGPVFPTMSIKGKVFTIVKDGVKTILKKPGEDDEVAQNIGVSIIRINMNSKVFYAKKFTEGDSDGARPDCYSYDGVAPSVNSVNPQAKKCALCPNNQWGSRISESGAKSKLCNDNARIAISAPDKLEPMLVRVPPASLKNLREAVKAVNARKIPYNATVMKISFDPQAASPTLLFKPIGLLGEEAFRAVEAEYDSEIVRAITGVDDVAHEGEGETPVGGASMDELDAALAARNATQQAAAKPAQAAAPAAPAAKPSVDEDELSDVLGMGSAAPAEPKAEPAPTKTRAPRAAKPAAPAQDAAPPAASGGDVGGLLGDLDALLGGTDD